LDELAETVLHTDGAALPTTGVVSAVFMMRLLAFERRVKLLGDDATEHLQRALPILFGKCFPEPTQVYPLVPRPCRRKKTPSSL
jgi:hypothetical protein